MIGAGGERIMTDERRNDAIERAAYEWLAAETSHALSRQERAALDAWLAADPAHRAIYEEAKAIWQGEAVREVLRDLARDRGFAARPAARRPVSWTAVAAGVAAAGIVVAALTAVVANPRAPTDPGGLYATAQAEISDIVLADGSTVTLGAQSQIAVHFRNDERRVVLEEGEAFFSVVSETRPFIVVADDTEVRVVGTKFEIRREHDGIRIGVAEGVVEVIHDAGVVVSAQTPERSVAFLEAGQQIVAATGRELAAAVEVDAAVPGAWRDRRLIYQNAPLEQVIADADRYYAGRITIASDEIKTLPITATFRSDDISEMIDLLSQTLPVAADRRSDGEIVLRAGADR
jgi:transmembrane sensor